MLVCVGRVFLFFLCVVFVVGVGVLVVVGIGWECVGWCVCVVGLWV